MKFAVSSYSLSSLVNKGEKTEKELISLAKELGFDGIEFAEIHTPDGKDKREYAKELRAECEKQGVEAVQYSVGADFIYGSDGDLDKEIERLKEEVMVAVELGVKGMRHDATGGYKNEEKKYNGFSQALPRIIKGYRAVTEYAEKYGIRTMIENHGYFCQDSDRVESIITGVNHPNFGALIDMGNFLCADEDPVKAVSRLAPFTSYLHAKDFHIKSGNAFPPCDGFFKSRGGNFLRGAVLGHGDVPVFQVMNIIKDSGYDGYVTLEFEGHEDAVTACRWGLNTLRAICKALDW
ncbi:MAG: sugar phosphate isomerase/epimerase [Clostridia bacterium]|nr:sugar phosphate isomerase/epimerase [Clostridia bacterium]